MASTGVSFTIREANKEDCKDILRLIKDLAEYEREPPSTVEVTEKTLIADGFTSPDQTFFYCFVAEVPSPAPRSDTASRESTVVGIALYNLAYSTWKGRLLFLEDFFVTKAYRSRGIGSALFKAVAKRAVELGCAGVRFSVLSWNQPSIDFYKRRGARDETIEGDWHYFMLDKQALSGLVKSANK